jgi:hypothetical protein
MATIDPSPTPDELKAIAAIFQSIAQSLQAYLDSAGGQRDANFGALTVAAINLNNAADGIAVMQLDLAVEQGDQALAVINQATAALKKAVEARNEITHDLGIVQALAGFGGSIAAGDIGGIVKSGTALYDALTAKTGSG